MPGVHFYIVSGLLAIIAITTHIAVDYVMEGTILKKSDFRLVERSNIDFDYRDPNIDVKFIQSNQVFEQEIEYYETVREQKFKEISNSFKERNQTIIDHKEVI